jgi:2-octaprenyl-6-methoxyphenol hydroxylase
MADRTGLDFELVIGGGSFAGLALARALAVSLGPELRIAVVDRAVPAADAAPKSDGRAVALSAGSRRLLEAIGVWQEIAAEAEPIRDIDITDTSLDAAIRPVILHYTNTLDGDEPASFVVESPHLLAALANSLRDCAGVTLLAPAEIETLDVDDHAARIGLAGGRELRARLAVAADGRQSRLRELAGIKCVGWRHAQIGIITIVAHEEPHRGRAVQHFLPAGPFAILPMTGKRSCVTWTEEEASGRAIMALDEMGFLAEVQRRFGYKLGTLSIAGPRAAFPLETHMARAFTAARLALVGDAAHAVHPIAGQGLNLALRDVAALTEIVAETVRLGLDPGSGEPLERYARWRRFDSLVSAAAMDALNRLFSNDWTLARTLRDAGLGVVDRLPGLKTFFVRQAAGLGGDIPKLLKGERV